MARKAEGWSLQKDRRTGLYTVRFRIAGKRLHRTTRCSDKAEAKGAAHRIYHRELEDRARALSGNPIMAELFSQWLDQSDLRGRYRLTQAKRTVPLAEHFATVADVTTKAVRGFIQERLKVVTVSTVQRDLVPLRECLRWAFDEGKIESLPTVYGPKKHARGTRAHDHRRVELTCEQVEALLLELPKQTRNGHPLRDVFTVVWDTGLRHGGIFRLESGRHFRRGRKELLLTADIDKCGWGRPMPLTDRAYQAIEENAPDIGPIFMPWDYRKSLRATAKGLELDPADLASLDMRDFRHAATTDGARKSGHSMGLAYMAGHENQRTTDRYIHPQIEDAREVLNARFPHTGHRLGHRTKRARGVDEET